MGNGCGDLFLDFVNRVGSRNERDFFYKNLKIKGLDGLSFKIGRVGEEKFLEIIKVMREEGEKMCSLEEFILGS